MAMLVIPIAIGLVAAAQRMPAHAAHAERAGGLLLVLSLVGIGLDLARSAG